MTWYHNKREITIKSLIIKDPDIIDIDWVQLLKNQRTEYLKEGKYFNYEKKRYTS